MSERDAVISLDWADGKQTFRLPIGQLEELQEKCDAGPPFILFRLSNDRWHVNDIRETIRLGLIGGGMEAYPAMKLVERYLDAGGNWVEASIVARAILHVALYGPLSEQLNSKKKAVKTRTRKTKPTQSNDGGSPTS